MIIELEHNVYIKFIYTSQCLVFLFNYYVTTKSYDQLKFKKKIQSFKYLIR